MFKTFTNYLVKWIYFYTKKKMLIITAQAPVNLIKKSDI